MKTVLHEKCQIEVEDIVIQYKDKDFGEFVNLTNTNEIEHLMSLKVIKVGNHAATRICFRSWTGVWNFKSSKKWVAKRGLYNLSFVWSWCEWSTQICWQYIQLSWISWLLSQNNWSKKFWIAWQAKSMQWTLTLIENSWQKWLLHLSKHILELVTKYLHRAVRYGSTPLRTKWEHIGEPWGNMGARNWNLTQTAKASIITSTLRHSPLLKLLSRPAEGRSTGSQTTPAGEDDTSMENHWQTMISEMKHARPNCQLLSRLMTLTYARRPMDLNAQMSVETVKDSWPALFRHAEASTMDFNCVAWIHVL